MSIVTLVMAFFSVLGAIDYILNNKFGLGKEWEKGFQMLGTMALTMIGMLVLAPFISHILSPALSVVAEYTFIEPSIIAGALLSNDMGGATLSLALAGNETIGYFNGLVVAAMMGSTISYTLPLAMGVVDKSQHRTMLIGLMCGIITIPLGCLVSGFMVGIPFVESVLNLIPLIVLAVVLTIGLIKIPETCVKIFRVLSIIIKIIIVIGLVIGIITFLTGYEILPYAAPIEDGIMIVFNSAIVMSGAFPLVYLVGKMIRKPLQALGRVTGLDDTSSIGLVASLATCVTTFSIMKHMNDKGVAMNSAFAVSGAFTFASHLAFTMAINVEYLPSVIVGKLVAGVLALVVTWFLYPKLMNEKEKGYGNN